MSKHCPSFPDMVNCVLSLLTKLEVQHVSGGSGGGDRCHVARSALCLHSLCSKQRYYPIVNETLETITLTKMLKRVCKYISLFIHISLIINIFNFYDFNF